MSNQYLQQLSDEQITAIDNSRCGDEYIDGLLINAIGKYPDINPDYYPRMVRLIKRNLRLFSGDPTEATGELKYLLDWWIRDNSPVPENPQVETVAAILADKYEVDTEQITNYIKAERYKSAGSWIPICDAGLEDNHVVNLIIRNIGKSPNPNKTDELIRVLSGEIKQSEPSSVASPEPVKSSKPKSSTGDTRKRIPIDARIPAEQSLPSTSYRDDNDVVGLIVEFLKMNKYRNYNQTQLRQIICPSMDSKRFYRIISKVVASNSDIISICKTIKGKKVTNYKYCPERIKIVNGESRLGYMGKVIAMLIRDFGGELTGSEIESLARRYMGSVDDKLTRITIKYMADCGYLIIINGACNRHFYIINPDIDAESLDKKRDELAIKPPYCDYS